MKGEITMNLDKCVKNLEGRGHKVSVFETKEEALAYLNSEITNTEVGIGGSITVKEMGLYDELVKTNIVHWHWAGKEEHVLNKENASPVYITGINALTEDGEILNIDGTGNRLAGQVFGQKKVYYISGINKICPDFNSALERARNIAAVKNCARFDSKNTPCKIDGKCHDCRSKDRICNALLVVWGRMGGMDTEVVLIKEELGY